MAVTAIRYASTLGIEVSLGFDEETNKERKKIKTISKISTVATDEQLYNIGMAIADVLKYELIGFHRTNKNELAG